jgi:hypothetical protein
MELSNNAMMVLGIYLGHKSHARRSECEHVGCDYDSGVAELAKAGVMRGGRINRKEGYAVFHERFPDQLGSQTHQYRHKLGFPYPGETQSR